MNSDKKDIERKFEFRKLIVDPGQTPMRIDLFLMDRLEHVTRNRIQNACRAQLILVGNKPVKPNYKIKPNQEIAVYMPKAPLEPGQVIAEKMDLDIRYEDDDILIVHKPPGLVVHPGIGNFSGTLVNGLVHYFNQNELPVMPGDPPDRPGLVHRIDKNTSGLLVIAKHTEAMSFLAKQFFDHSIEREYYALVWGNFEEESGTITGHIGRHPRDRKKRFVFPDGDEGKHAITHYEVIEDMYYVSLVRCRLETGRTHQIRVHMSHKNHPLFSDDVYGGDRIIKGTIYSKYKQFVKNCFDLMPRQALHAKSLGLIHPRTKEFVKFESELPDDFASVLDKWRHYVQHKRSTE